MRPSLLWISQSNATAEGTNPSHDVSRETRPASVSRETGVAQASSLQIRLNTLGELRGEAATSVCLSYASTGHSYISVQILPQWGRCVCRFAS